MAKNAASLDASGSGSATSSVVSPRSKARSNRSHLALPPFSLCNVKNDVRNLVNEKVKAKQLQQTTDGPPTTTITKKAKQDYRTSFDESLQGVIRLLHGRKNVVVLVGAGISVSCGIPDFRSKGSGLYSTLDIESLGLSCPEELFDYEFFQHDPEPFYKFARHLYFPLDDVAKTNNDSSCDDDDKKDVDPNLRRSSRRSKRRDTGQDSLRVVQSSTEHRRVEPSDSHKLLALLEQHKMLLRVYTQNIDGLETTAGVSSRKMVYAHGSLKWAKCCKCQRKVDSDYIMPSIEQGRVPRCQVTKSIASPAKAAAIKSRKINIPTLARSSSSTISSSSTSSSTPNFAQTSMSDTAGLDNSSRRKRQRTHSSTDREQDLQQRPRSTSTSSTATNEGASAQSSPTKVRVCGGVLKPGVTFFGETLSDSVTRSLESDKKKVDALIVIGTSLSVAPISKVIEYLPSGIPRILINRTVVHPSSIFKSSANTDSDESDDDENKREKFGFVRDNYVFDAYLLGFCDDVTRALARQLFKSDNEDSQDNKSITGNSKDRNNKKGSKKQNATNPDCGGRLLSSLLERENKDSLLEDEEDGNDHGYDVEEWREAVSVPPERVLLFPGALPVAHAERSNSTADNEEGGELTYREIAHCDGCSKRIRGTIQKCAICFDYDLCSKCFPKLSRSHYGGTHKFNSEPAGT